MYLYLVKFPKIEFSLTFVDFPPQFLGYLKKKINIYFVALKPLWAPWCLKKKKEKKKIIKSFPPTMFELFKKKYIFYSSKTFVDTLFRQNLKKKGHSSKIFMAPWYLYLNE